MSLSLSCLIILGASKLTNRLRRIHTNPTECQYFQTCYLPSWGFLVMSPFADLDKPPFFTAIYLTPEEGGNHGLHSEAVATLVSGATLVPGFVGFTNDVAVAKRPIKVLYWRTFRAMQAWQRKVKDLLPNNVDLESCVASEGCHWKWFELEQAYTAHPLRRVA